MKEKLKMFCPKCAVEINSDETKSCSKCEFTIKSVRNVVEQNGKDESEISNFEKGLRFGVKLLLLAVILFPVIQILSGLFPPDDKLVESSSEFDVVRFSRQCGFVRSDIKRNRQNFLRFRF